ncbi:MAG: hypothetical protein HY909_20585 [Deltaproteobacteria bacterium]|nr:hypothetical protein [Deltaproteobacteria bacterium]
MGTTHARGYVSRMPLGGYGLLAALTACSDSGAAQDDGGAPDADPRLDVAAVELRPPPPGPLGCRAVDVLFMIDNSPSMRPKQERLAAAFPTFVDAMFDRLPRNTDLHVGITTSSFTTMATMEGHADCRTSATPEYIMSRYQTPGMLNNNENGGQGRLFRHEGMVFFTANTSGDREALKRWFTAAAPAVGERSSSVECSSAGVAYVTDPANAGVNQGFIRDLGAVMVIVALTDEPDKSPEGARRYHDLFVRAKEQCGGDRCIVTAGILPPCAMGANEPLYQFLNAFGRPPTIGDIEGTSMDYTRVVGDALARTVSELCSNIPAPP